MCHEAFNFDESLINSIFGKKEHNFQDFQIICIDKTTLDCLSRKAYLYEEFVSGYALYGPHYEILQGQLAPTLLLALLEHTRPVDITCLISTLFWAQLKVNLFYFFLFLAKKNIKFDIKKIQINISLIETNVKYK